MASFPSVAAIQEFIDIPFDYIVIGGGTAGLPIANRLSENPNIQVGILEAGLLIENDDIIDIPGNMAKNNGNPTYDWVTKTTPQPGCNDRSIPIFRGKVVGGSSVLNYMGWDRGSKIEYDAWKLLSDAKGWDWDALLPSFTKPEDAAPTSVDLAIGYSRTANDVFTTGIPKEVAVGTGGPVKLSYNAQFADPVQAYVKGWNELGHHTNANPFGGDASGVYNANRSVDFESGKRVTSTSAYYTPVASRSNLKLLTGAQVTKIVFKKDLVDGKVVAHQVEFSVDGKVYSVNVSKEVVLSAGTIQTPAILQLSGIGDRKLLSAEGINIEVKVDLPGVGENLHDHSFSRIHYEAKLGNLTFDKLRNDPEFLQEQETLYKEKKQGWRASNDTTLVFTPLNKIMKEEALAAEIQNLEEDIEAKKSAGSLSELEAAQYAIQLDWLKQANVPHVEFVIFSRGLVNPQPGKSYFAVNTGLQHPFSRGSVYIQSNDPLQQPAVDPRYLSHDFDVRSLLAAYRAIEALAKTDAMTAVIQDQVAPAKDMTDAEVINYIRQAFSTGAHFMGTAAMARRELGGVVGSDLKVHGTTNVRVADASIIPIPLAAHIQGTVYAIAEKAADLIKADQV
ncbi:alcohol oxidase [Mycena polygramma]|nr:alcohol oxidase [Mycena polygramma]